MTIRIGMLLFPGVTQLDLTGPFEVLAQIPGAEINLAWKVLDPVTAESGLKIVPTTTLSDAPQADVLFVPGGAGQLALMRDEEVLSFLRRQGEKARYVTAVCTGSLLLGAAGLLEGYDATTHWAFHDLLARCGARPVRKRVVIDRNRVTGGGVTAGIDFSLRLVSELVGEDIAREIQLALEYDPDPPFSSGSPERADPRLVERVRQTFEPLRRARAASLDHTELADHPTAGSAAGPAAGSGSPPNRESRHQEG
jgi:cyclohexyl-isocyanide hydratase